MPYIGQQPTSIAFLTDTFSGNGSTTAFTLSAAPAGTSSILVAISGVVQDPSTYSVVGTTLTFSPAPPTGTGNISVRFLGIPASGVTTTAYRTVTEFTATAGQTTFSTPSYTPGFIDVYRNGVMLGSADYTATNGVSVVLASGATAGDLVEVISFSVSSVLNAIPNSPASVGTSNLVDGSVTTSKIASSAVDLTTKVTGVLPQANGGTGTTIGYNGFKNRIINGAMVIDQRNAGASASSGTNAFTYTVDRWSCFATGAAAAVQRVAGSGSFQSAVRVTGASSNTDANLIQRIESFNCFDLANGPAVLSAVLSGSSSGNVTWALSYANATDTWAGSTAIASGTWNITTTPTQFTAQINLPSAATTGLQLVIGFGALGSGVTRTVTGVQLEKGSTATSFDYRPYGTELQLCQRYFEFGTAFAGPFGTGATGAVTFPYAVVKRSTPVLSVANNTSWTGAAAGTTTAGSGVYNTTQTIGLYNPSNTTIGANWTASAEL